MNNETEIIKKELRYAIINKRAELDIPQTKMAELLGIAPRSYVDIEHGISMPRTQTLIKFMCLFKDDAMMLIEKIITKLNETDY